MREGLGEKQERKTQRVYLGVYERKLFEDGDGSHRNLREMGRIQWSFSQVKGVSCFDFQISVSAKRDIKIPTDGASENTKVEPRGFTFEFLERRPWL